MNAIVKYPAGTAVLLLLLTAVMPMADAASAAEVVDLDVKASNGGVSVVVQTTGSWTSRSFEVEDPDRLVIDIVGAVKQFKGNRIVGDGKLLHSVRSSQYRTGPNPITRVVLDLVGRPGVKIDETENGLLVALAAAGSDNETAVELPSFLAPTTDPQVVFDPVGGQDPARAYDNWQDGGIERIADPSSRQDDASYARVMNINMQNADIKTILRAVADFSGRNIITAPAVEGQVTVALHDVPWREALGVILRANAFGYVEENGIIRVDTAANLRSEELQEKAANKQNDELESLITQIVAIDFANAEEIKSAVEGMLTSRGAVQVDDRTNSLIVSDIPSSVDALASLARELDTKTPQVHIDALLVDLDSRRSSEIGIEWGAINVNPDFNAVGDLVVSNPIQEVAGQLRVGSVRDFGELRLTIQGLARDNIADIISNPRITTTNNREANILVGQKIPLITTDVAGNPITRLETIGIRLIVTPHINSDRQITLDVHPEVSDLSSQATVQGGVIINTSEADTRVLVGNRDTAVIGGLIRRVATHFTAGVPVLKDLPIIGALFRSEAKTDDQRELIVFLTPTIVTDDAIDIEREMQMKEKIESEIQGRAMTSGL